MSSKGLRQVARAKNVVKIRVVENGEWRAIGLADENVMCVQGGGFIVTLFIWFDLSRNFQGCSGVPRQTSTVWKCCGSHTAVNVHYPIQIAFIYHD